MRLTTVRLESLKPGATIQSDIIDPLGRLLLKAPKVLDEITKKILLKRGIAEVVVEDDRVQSKVENIRDIDKELELLEKRLVHLSNVPSGAAWASVILETVRDFYLKNHHGDELFKK